MNLVEKKSLQQNAMFYGTILGIYWVILFITYIIGLRNAYVAPLFLILLIISPFLAANFAIRYKKASPSEPFAFIEAWGFMLIMYICASLFSSLSHAVYFLFIDNGEVIEIIKQQFQLIIKDNNAPKEQIEAYSTIIQELNNIKPRDIIIQLLATNFFFGTIISLITAIFIKNKIKKV